MKRCLIIGGGIAGLTAASILSSKNISVTLLESAPKLGGRSYSFLDKTTNTFIDNGQHIMMGCYSFTLSLIKLVGAENNFEYQKNLSLKFLGKNKKEFHLNADSFFYPINLLYAILNYNIFNISEKLAFVWFILKLPLISKKALKNITVKIWLEKENQNDNLIKYFWEILCVGAVNTSTDKASALIFYEVLIQIFLKGNLASTIILPKYGLSESLINPAVNFIEMSGGKIIKSETVKEIIIKNKKVVSVITDNHSYDDFDFVISAVPQYALEKIIPLDYLNIDLDLKYSTILNIHLWAKGNYFKEKFYGLLDSPLHWVFVKENNINVVISDADYLAEKSKDEVYNFVMTELMKFIPINKEEVRYFKIIKEKRATFIPDKMILDRRPNAETNIKNLYLAGDWTNTNLPSTIEGAAKSGNIASELVLNQC